MSPAAELPRRALGVIAPSANVVVEWTVQQLLRAAPAMGAHISRVKVAGSVDPFPDGYDTDGFAAAAALIADARPDAIVWAGSKGVLVGMEQERALKARIEDTTGVPFTSAALALEALADAMGLAAIGLVTPYGDAYQARLIAGFAKLGITVIAERHTGISDNLAYAAIEPSTIVAMADEVALECAGRAQALVAWCTNLPSGALADVIERRTGLPFVDATTLALHHALTIIGAEVPVVPGWGRMYSSASILEPSCAC